VIVSAHIAGVPVEEMIPAAAGAGGALCLARAWVWIHLRRAARGRDPLPEWRDEP
jgi:hypothetical protein